MLPMIFSECYKSQSLLRQLEMLDASGLSIIVAIISLLEYIRWYPLHSQSVEGALHEGKDRISLNSGAVALLGVFGQGNWNITGSPGP